MALIKCPECNQEISDKSNVCIHCGYPLGSQQTTSLCDETLEANDNVNGLTTSKSEKVQSFKFLKNKKVIFSIISVLALIAVVFGAITIASNSLSSEEEYGLKMVEKYKDMLKNPDSFVLRSDIAVISYSRDGKIYKYVFFDASGENSYGASVTSTPCFVDGKYLCDSDDIPSVSEYMSMSDAKAKVYLGLQLALAHWNLYGDDAAEKNEDVIESYSISAEKIAKKLDIGFNID